MNPYWIGVGVGCFIGFICGLYVRGAVRDLREWSRERKRREEKP
jgi:hypothetical protein